MAQTDLAVRIATILDSTGLNKADKAVGGFEKKLKTLAKTLGATLSVSAVVAFGKASAEAFIKDQQEAAKLANVMKNLGLELANPAIAGYIDNLQRISGVSDDQLRPALQGLVQQTGDLRKSQELLGLAIEMARGSGESLATTSNDLAQAFVGNTKSLKKYNLGLTAAELKAASFTDIQKKLTNQFKGSNAAYLETYAGKMEVLKTAAGEAQETIGKGLLDALALIGGDTSVSDLATSMQNVATFTGDAILGMGVLIDKVGTLGNTMDSNILTTFFKAAAETSGIGLLSKLGASQKPYVEDTNSLQARQHAAYAAAAAKKKADADAAKRAKEQLAATKKNTAELKKQALAKKQQGLLDVQQANIIAALQGKITAEEKLRLELQLALLTGNDEKAAKLSKELANSIDSTGQLSKWLTTLPDAKNPFAGWDAWLIEFQKKLAATQAFTMSGGSVARGQDFAALNPTVSALVTGASGAAAGSTKSGDVYISINGSVVSEQDLVTAVQNGLQYNSLAGKPSDIGRIAGMFG